LPNFIIENATIIEYLHKGYRLYLEGKLRYRQYDDKSGQKKYVTEIIADKILLLDKKADSGSQENDCNAGNLDPL